jgi:hypothetical protein
MHRPSESQPPASALTRWVGGFIVFFLVDAAQLLLLAPDMTDDLWAWEILPETTAMVLASAYVGGAYFFVRVVLGAPWRQVAAGFLPVIVFVWFAAAATFLHLDRFIEENIAFAAWISLYTLTPIAIPLLYAWERRRAGAGERGEALPSGVRVVLGAVGGAVVAGAVVMLVSPSTAIDEWPWSLTPLTTRILAAVIALYGTVWVSAALNGTRAGTRIPFHALALALAFFLLALVRGGDDVDWDNALAPILAGLAGAMLVTSLLLARSGPARGGPTGPGG